VTVPAASSVNEQLPVAVPFVPESAAEQLRVPSETVTVPVGVGEPAVVVGPTTLTAMLEARPRAGEAGSEVIDVVVALSGTGACVHGWQPALLFAA
jgi:hypothetical protein